MLIFEMDINVFSAADLDEPTQNGCRVSDNTQKVFAIVAAFVIGAIVMAIICVVSTITVYRCHKQTQRTKRQRDMPDSEKKRHEQKYEENVEKLPGIDKKKNKTYYKQIKKTIKFHEGHIRGECGEPDSNDAENP